MTDITHRTVQTNGIRMHIAESGQGPLVLLCHGFPETWYSWRHQLPALAAAGYHAVAPDQRGYGQTDAPEAIDRYTSFHLVGDMVGLLDALGETTAVIVGHDWGAIVAWQATLLRPDRFRAVAALSVPFVPRGPLPPTQMFRMMAGDNFFYILYFQEPGVAEAELDRDPRRALRATLYTGSGDAPEGAGWRLALHKEAGFLDALMDPPALPSWLTEADVDAYAADFARSGFRGGINWYRNFDRNWELGAPWQGAQVTVPALFVAGDRDLVIAMMGDAVQGMPQLVPGLTRSLLLPGCGHWTQQERPTEVNEALLTFLHGL
ncbi:MAG: alpha/beta hydrolase [Dehalococcoidia bacterium]